MKRYLLFSCYDYEVYGGWDDLRGDFDSISQAWEAYERIIASAEYYYAHVVDITKDSQSAVIHRWINDGQGWRYLDETQRWRFVDTGQLDPILPSPKSGENYDG